MTKDSVSNSGSAPLVRYADVALDAALLESPGPASLFGTAPCDVTPYMRPQKGLCS